MDEVNKLLATNFIREVYHSKWLANVVMAKIANGKWRICVYFTYLNGACQRTTSFCLELTSLWIQQLGTSF